mmetsp:Transcript_33257/g.24437  ORF Transcript_33257/g.24437 Transcript_33257/m.24437 type:complete len:82 (-) Transcript_33257:625-870(-)
MVLASTPFKILPHSSFILFFLVSTIVTLKWLYNEKTYNLVDFEELYVYLKKKSNLQVQELIKKKQKDPFDYYKKVLMFFRD